MNYCFLFPRLAKCSTFSQCVKRSWNAINNNTFSNAVLRTANSSTATHRLNSNLAEQGLSPDGASKKENETFLPIFSP